MINRADIALVMKGRQSVFLSESAIDLKRQDDGKVTATLCINAATSEIELIVIYLYHNARDETASAGYARHMQSPSRCCAPGPANTEWCP